MGLYPEDSKEGFAVLNRWGGIWKPVLYRNKQQAIDELLNAGFSTDDIGKTFKISRARFSILEAEMEVDDELALEVSDNVSS